MDLVGMYFWFWRHCFTELLTEFDGDLDEVEEILQASFVEFLERREYTEILHPLAYCRKVLKHRLIQRQREMRRTARNAAGSVLHYDSVDESTLIADMLDAAVQSDLFRPRQRKIIGLVHILGYGQVEAARIIGMSKSNVSRGLVGINRRLQEIFRAHGIEPE